MSVVTVDQALLFDLPDDADPEEGSIAWAKQQMAIFREKSDVFGGLITQTQAALILGISRQCVAQYVSRGHLTVHEILGGKYLGGTEVIEFAKREKLKGGRPSKLAIWASALNRS